MPDVEVEHGIVFSAHAEVVPLMISKTTWSRCILRARGGSSDLKEAAGGKEEYSPRTRR